MKRFYLISNLILLLLIQSCKEDEIGNINEELRPTQEPAIIIEEYGRAKVIGYVKDKNEEPLPNVKVFFGEKTAFTNAEGKYELDEVNSSLRSRIWFEKDGFVSTQKLIETIEYLPNRLDAVLYPIAKSVTLTNEGGIIEDDNFSVEFSPNSFIYDIDKKEVRGNIRVDVTPFLISEPDFFSSVPGFSFGRDKNNSLVPIKSYGVINVSLTAKGEKVQLKEGKTSIIKIKAPEYLPSELTMWFYDEFSGEWQEEGIGNVENGFLTAEVSHFTRWYWGRNANPISRIRGRILGNGGIPLEGAIVYQTVIKNIFQNVTRTNRDGEFTVLTLAGHTVDLEIYFENYKAEVLSVLGPGSSGTTKDIGDISFDVSAENIVPPFIKNKKLFIDKGTYSMEGEYLGVEKRPEYRLLLNGVEIETIKWTHNKINFKLPEIPPLTGTIQVDRDGMLSEAVPYEYGEWDCEIDGRWYRNEEMYNGDDTKLLLYGREMESLPECVGNLQNVKELGLLNNNLSDLPESISNLNLERLHIDENSFVKLPDVIFTFENLKQLSFSGNELTIINDQLGNLQNLISINGSHNRISTLPQSIGELLNLEYLSISYNNLTTLPESIGSLGRLRSISVMNNQLTSLPDIFQNMDSLTGLGLINNNLESLPNSISESPKLSVLALSGNNFKTIPNNILDIENLTSLFLDSNQIISLPNDISRLQNLKDLRLSSNQISSLPDDIGNMKNLELLILMDNQLTSLPESIKGLKDILKMLYLKGNNFSDTEKAKVESWLPHTNINWDSLPD